MIGQWLRLAEKAV